MNTTFLKKLMLIAGLAALTALQTVQAAPSESRTKHHQQSQSKVIYYIEQAEFAWNIIFRDLNVAMQALALSTPDSPAIVAAYNADLANAAARFQAALAKLGAQNQANGIADAIVLYAAAVEAFTDGTGSLVEIFEASINMANIFASLSPTIESIQLDVGYVLPLNTQVTNVAKANIELDFTTAAQLAPVEFEASRLLLNYILQNIL